MPMHPGAYYAGYRAALDNDHAMTNHTVPSVIPGNPFDPNSFNYDQFCSGYSDAILGL